jgi:hypothetical protein
MLEERDGAVLCVGERSCMSEEERRSSVVSEKRVVCQNKRDGAAFCDRRRRESEQCLISPELTVRVLIQEEQGISQEQHQHLAVNHSIHSIHPVTKYLIS